MAGRTAALVAMVLAVAACESTVARTGSPTHSPTAYASSAPVESAQPATPARVDATPPPVVNVGASIPTNSGQISGRVGYPAGGLPAQTVYAIATDNTRAFRVETSLGQVDYRMVGVTPGDYFVLDAGPIGVGVLPGDPVSSEARLGVPAVRFRAGYTRAVVCGLDVSCADHTLVAVHVSAGHATTGVDPVDWYAPDPAAVFPLIPSPADVYARPGVPDVQSLNGIAYRDPLLAVSALSAADTTSRYVASASQCPYNVACVWVTGRHDGQSALYYTVTAGSNGVTQNCAIYLTLTAPGWRELGNVSWSTECTSAGAPFPTVGASGPITLPFDESGCVRIHSAPSLSASVVACLALGTSVTIDSGPVYALAAEPRPQTTLPWTLDYWWHVAGRGWMVHTYLIPYHVG